MKYLKWAGSLFLLFTAATISLSLQASPQRPSPRTQASGAPAYVNSRLTGTYQLDRASSEDAQAAVVRATGSLPPATRRLVIEDVRARLESPSLLAIERQGMAISIASSLAPRIRLSSDGQEYLGPVDIDGMARARATLYGDLLEISSLGEGRNSDFNVVYESVDGGRRLEVTRRIYPEGMDQAIIVRSFYLKTSNLPQWNIYHGT